MTRVRSSLALLSIIIEESCGDGSNACARVHGLKKTLIPPPGYGMRSIPLNCTTVPLIQFHLQKCHN